MKERLLCVCHRVNEWGEHRKNVQTLISKHTNTKKSNPVVCGKNFKLFKLYKRSGIRRVRLSAGGELGHSSLLMIVRNILGCVILLDEGRCFGKR